MSDKEVMHRYILARVNAERHKGTELGEHWAKITDERFNDLSVCAQVQVKLDTPDENVGL